MSKSMIVAAANLSAAEKMCEEMLNKIQRAQKHINIVAEGDGKTEIQRKVVDEMNRFTSNALAAIHFWDAADKAFDNVDHIDA